MLPWPSRRVPALSACLWEYLRLVRSYSLLLRSAMHRSPGGRQPPTTNRELGPRIASMISQAARAELLLGIDARDALVLEYPDHDATVLGLALGGLVFAVDLAALAHRARSQHVGQRNMALLQNDVGNVISTLIAELLVYGSTAGGGSVPFDLDHVAVDGLCFFCQCDQLRVVLRIHFYLAIAE